MIALRFSVSFANSVLKGRKALGRRKARPLLIGIGNPLRSDDGLGWAVAAMLAQDGDTDYDIQTVHQLTPELAQWMVAADLVVMIDASYEGEPGDLRIRPVSLSAQPGAVGTHYATPEELAALTAGIYGYCPAVVVVTMTGVDFSMGERLSSVVAGRIGLVCEAVRGVCAHDLSSLKTGSYHGKMD